MANILRAKPALCGVAEGKRCLADTAEGILNMINKLCGNIPEIKGYHEFERATEAAKGTTIGLLYYKHNQTLLREI